MLFLPGTWPTHTASQEATSLFDSSQGTKSIPATSPESKLCIRTIYTAQPPTCKWNILWAQRMRITRTWYAQSTRRSERSPFIAPPPAAFPVTQQKIIPDASRAEVGKAYKGRLDFLKGAVLEHVIWYAMKKTATENAYLKIIVYASVRLAIIAWNITKSLLHSFNLLRLSLLTSQPATFSRRGSPHLSRHSPVL